MNSNPIVFGTYHLKGNLLEKSLQQAFDAGIRHFDTAKLYKNEQEVGNFCTKIIQDNKLSDGEIIWITTKIYEKKLKSIDTLIRQIHETIITIRPPNFKDQIKIRVLLHHPMGYHVWKALEICQEYGIIDEIGVSNHNVQALEKLYYYCQIPPSVNQLEVHPFLPQAELEDLLKYCRQKNLPVQGHTILTKGIYINHPQLIQCAQTCQMTPIQYLVNWALFRPGIQTVCITTSSQDHLIEILQATKLPVATLLAVPLKISTIEADGSLTNPEIRLYPWVTEHSNQTEGPVTIRSYQIPDIANQLKLDLLELKKYLQENKLDPKPDPQCYQKPQISNLAYVLPIIKSKYTNFSLKLAKLMFANQSQENQNDTYYYQKFKDVLKPLRNFCYDRDMQSRFTQRKESLTGKTCCLLKNRKPLDTSGINPNTNTDIGKSIDQDLDLERHKGDAISDLVVNPIPMPVEITSEESLQPFLQYLKENREFLTLSKTEQEKQKVPLEFYRGAIFEDGRMDMCKQVVGPDHIGKLCQAVQHNNHIKHFLLGNNIAFQDHPDLAQHIANIIATNQPIETWYLAGNCIDNKAVQIISEALIGNFTAQALWLKRNPIGPIGAIHLGQMLSINRTLTLLDLHNCGLLDIGAINFALHAKNSVLKHLYIDANGITPIGAKALAEWCQSHKNTLKTFYCSINRIGDMGAQDILEALQGSPTLKRLCLASNRITDRTTPLLIETVLSCPNLKTLDLGSYKSTFDLGEQPNFLTRAQPFHRLVEEHPKLEFLDLTMNQINREEITELVELCKKQYQNLIKPLTIYGAQANSNPHEKSLFCYDAHPNKRHIKLLKHPKKVLNIDSIYRNNM